jgi:hypothetical protein
MYEQKREREVLKQVALAANTATDSKYLAERCDTNQLTARQVIPQHVPRTSVCMRGKYCALNMRFDFLAPHPLPSPRPPHPF